ncbi:hypothetical protein RGE_11900 [Rubrivivax gelatinosus IL144]|uniref:Uncharacterized protein n=1 Tax=Rubrivivax gelatinosus (strain NBRC 100245 / IL144) TaxID=983917 RepID=I0HNE4_RUBGI|nr:hypothetical protein RGE_11900 [Rubrivivax gelatinosus IL144]
MLKRLSRKNAETTNTTKAVNRTIVKLDGNGSFIERPNFRGEAQIAACCNFSPRLRC